MVKTDRIIISFTSWKKRIDRVCHSIDLMLSQTIKPDKIILNLSSDEFPKKEQELPKCVLDKINDIFEIFWIKENVKVYKKIIPSLIRFPHDVVIAIDDDIEYPKDYIETLYNEYLKHDKKNPICCYRNNEKRGIFRHSGPFSLVKAEFFGPYLKDLYYNVVMKYGISIIPASDDIYFYAALLNGCLYKVVDQDKLDFYKKLYSSTRKNPDSYSSYDSKWRSTWKNEVELIKKYIKEAYNKSYDDLVNNCLNKEKHS